MLQFQAPPLPFFLTAGEDTYSPGQIHPNRKNIGVFDLLIVTRGCLIMAENKETFQVREQQALILYPDRHHYSAIPCETETHFYWLHFYTVSKWKDLNEESIRSLEYLRNNENNVPFSDTFLIRIPKYCTIHDWSTIKLLCEQLISTGDLPSSSDEWKKQIQFQQLMQKLAPSNYLQKASPAMAIAEQAASYLRKNFANKIDYKKLGDTLCYHPNYIAKCMMDTFGFSPIEYVNQVRIDQSKLLLITTDWSIEKIAENCGFQQSSYFSRFFKKHEGITPNQFRKQYEVKI